MRTRFIVHENEFDTDEESEIEYNRRYLKLGFLRDYSVYSGFYKDVAYDIKLNMKDRVRIITEYEVLDKSYCLMNNLTEYFLHEL